MTIPSLSWRGKVEGEGDDQLRLRLFTNSLLTKFLVDHTCICTTAHVMLYLDENPVRTELGDTASRANYDRNRFEVVPCRSPSFTCVEGRGSVTESLCWRITNKQTLQFFFSMARDLILIILTNCIFYYYLTCNEIVFFVAYYLDRIH